jgi:hypothetical protein
MEMKTSLTIVLVAVVMSVTTAGYAKVFDEEQADSSFEYAIENENSITPEDIAGSETSKTMGLKKLDLIVNFSCVVGRKTLSVDKLTASNDIFNAVIEDMNLNAERIFEQEVRSYEDISEEDLWANTDMNLFIEELADPCNLLMIAIAR